MNHEVFSKLKVDSLAKYWRCVGLSIGTHDLKEIVVLLLGHDRRTCPLGRKVSAIERTTVGWTVGRYVEAVTLYQVIIL